MAKTIYKDIVPTLPLTIAWPRQVTFPPWGSSQRGICHKLSLGYLQLLDLVEIYLYPSPGMVVEVKNLPAKARDIRYAGSVPGFGRSSGGGYSNPLQYSCLENPMDRGAWRATVHRVTKSWTQLKQLSRHTCTVSVHCIKFRPTFQESHQIQARIWKYIYI